MDIDFSKTLQRGRLNCGWLEREHIEGDKTMIVLKICEKLMPRREQEEIYLKHSRGGGYKIFRKIWILDFLERINSKLMFISVLLYKSYMTFDISK